jgi:hypothetical protein
MNIINFMIFVMKCTQLLLKVITIHLGVFKRDSWKTEKLVMNSKSTLAFQLNFLLLFSLKKVSVSKMLR